MKLSPPVAFLLTGLLLAVPAAKAQAPAGQTAPERQQTPPEQRQPRPQPEALKLPDLPPVPDAVLTAWATKTKEIKKLDGKLQRISYEEVFQVEKHSSGEFFFEAPDKGRITLQGFVPKEEMKGNVFPLAPGDSEEWVCDGERIFQMDPKAKECNIFAIPEDARGTNIMHGPLPFLFGMPPEIAKNRYWLFLHSHDETSFRIVAYPKWAADRQNYTYADVVLSKKTFLPLFIKLRNPSENGDTVYRFAKVTVNRKIAWFRGNPFEPNLKDYQKPITHAAAQPQRVASRTPVMPTLVGLHADYVKKIAQELDVTVKFRRGEPAVREALKYHAYRQHPPKGTPLSKGDAIVVTLYDAPQKAD